MTAKEAFFRLHEGLPREGPGCRDDVNWAIDIANLAQDARILDAGCGPGADIEGLLACAPKGYVTAVDKHPAFIEAVNVRWGADRRVSAFAGDMRNAEGPFDFIWCAGAIYFLGLETGLPLLGAMLAPSGAIAFSDMVYLNSNPNPELRAHLEAEVPQMRTQFELQAEIQNLGFRALGQRVLPKLSWETYYKPTEQRIAMLRASADAALCDVLDAAETEIAMWRRHSDQFGYVLSVVRAV